MTPTSDRLFCVTLDGLAFLPTEKVKEGMIYLCSVMPPDAAPVVNYFDSTYVTSVVSTALSGSIRRQPPKFRPAMWNVCAATSVTS